MYEQSEQENKGTQNCKGEVRCTSFKFKKNFSALEALVILSV